MNKKIAIIVAVLAVCLTASLYFSYLGHSEKAIEVIKPVVHSSAVYTYIEMEDLIQQAEVVVNGIVKERGESQIVKIPISTEMDVTNENEGKFLENVETPITIEVTEYIKNKENKSTIIYWEEGGELSDKIVMPDHGFLQKGDEIILFLNESGHSWGAQGVLKVKDGKVSLLENKQDKEYLLADLKIKLKNILE
ncbi:hypothetical protein EHS13_17430 [Paenibacillus psychroresistens]|uniref:Uncharacterized protein n=1 Tax=Paenibacillus psychroresistens TaxID=1778678 RepID=A0A6B8RJT9_9BACL|nr:hypothetical protein [Paenibacillus psychroresistens]QGQ96540.1 hypothetical protein EHS13_17430 [Paenibacillus psychroresistens]